MKSITYVSQKERRLILMISSLVLFLSIASFLCYNVKAEYERSEYYRLQELDRAQGKPTFAGAYCFPDRHPQFLLQIVFVSGITVFLVCISIRYLLSFLSTSILFALFINWFTKTPKEISYDYVENFRGLNKVFYNANIFDIAVFFLVLILLFWQFSVLLRILIKTPQRNLNLP